MRPQTWILAVALLAGLVLGGLLLAQRGTLRAARASEARAVAASSAAAEHASARPAQAALVEPSMPSEAAPREETRRVEDAAASLAPSTEFADLLDEVRAARARGLLDDRRLGEFLAQVYLEQGDPRRALELLRSCGSRNMKLWSNLVQAFAKRGDLAGQKEAVLAALEFNGQNPFLLDMLANVDPGLAAARLQKELALQPPPGGRNLRLRLARALANGGREAEARSVLEELLAQSPGDVEALQALSELDPAGALALVERLATLAPDGAEMRGMLVNLYAEVGDLAGAEAALDRLARLGTPIEPSEWGELAEQWLGAGNAARGISALNQAMALEHGDPDPWVHQLEDLAPDQLLVQLERRVAGDEAHNDEYWGSLADSYWAAGRHEDARAAWERAFALDPGDGEWPVRLRALREGLDPYE